MATPRLVRLNAALAERLGLDPDALAGPEGVEVLAGNRVPEGAEPVALAYAGHQFGQFVPQLGDGRAILIGQGHRDAPRRWRGDDGRARFPRRGGAAKRRRRP